jgi:hypothetical protein
VQVRCRAKTPTASIVVEGRHSFVGVLAKPARQARNTQQRLLKEFGRPTRAEKVTQGCGLFY